MKWLKEFFIEQKLNAKAEASGTKSLPPFERIKAVTILSDSEGESILARKAMAKIWENPIQIKFIYRETNPAYECYDYEDFNFLGQPKEKIQNIISDGSDLILVTHKSMDPLTAYFVKLMPEVYSMGFYDAINKQYLDLMLEHEDVSMEQNLSNLVKYLKKIN